MTTIDQPAPKKDWVHIVFLTLTPVIGVFGTALYTWHAGFHPWMFFLFLSLYVAVGLSVCAGYHRYFSHKSYECSPVVQAAYAVFGAMAAQNSILAWSAGHRRHHKHVDTDWDPYNIRRGFWWAHILWIFYITEDPLDNVRDLQKNPIVKWQHRWYTALVIVAGFGLPTLIGACFGDALAGLLWGGFLRVIVVHHSTFFVNSISHIYGSCEFDEEGSARDNWMVSLLTFGEGYHNFHHRFPSDYRNGIRWYQWDPSKWLIGGLKLVGLASDLRSTAAPLIEQARIKVALKTLEARIEHALPQHESELRERIRRAHVALDDALRLWRRQAEERAQGMSKAWKSTHRRYKRRLRHARHEWRGALRNALKIPLPVDDE